MTHVTLTPIGTSPAWYNPGEPASGFLLEAGGFRVLIDCGSGVISRYLALHEGDPPSIDAIVITHVHADHVLDLVPLGYAIQYGQLRSWRPRLLLPPRVHGRLQQVIAAWDGPASFFVQTFDVEEYEPGESFAVGPFRVSAHGVPHFIEAWALRFEHPAGTFGYTSDLGPSPAAARFLHGVDLLLTEATLPVEHGELPELRGHLTAEEAGQLATEAATASLLLTHVPAELDFDDVRARAARHFDGDVAVAISGRPVLVRATARTPG